MFKFNPFRRRSPSSKAAQTGAMVANRLEISIGEIHVKIERITSTQPQNELTAVMPRVEIRRKCYLNGTPAVEEEMILNSITLVDAPRHPSETRKKLPEHPEQTPPG